MEAAGSRCRISSQKNQDEGDGERIVKSGADSQGTESTTGSGSKSETAVQQRQTEMLPETIPAIAAGTASGTNGGNYGDGTGGEKTDGDDKNNKSRIKNHSGNKTKTKRQKDRQYFRTTIENGGTVTKADYSYQIEQLTDLKVLKTENTLNDGKVTNLPGKSETGTRRK